MWLPQVLMLRRILSNYLFTSSIVFIHGLQGHPRETWSYTTPAGTEPITPTRPANRARFHEIFYRDPNAQSAAAEQIHEGCIFWPFDLLRADCPNARIITWGYDSVITRFFDGAVNQGSIFAHAKDLLFALCRERTGCVSRPPVCG